MNRTVSSYIDLYLSSSLPDPVSPDPTSYLILFLPTSYLILFLPTSYLILFLPTSYLILFLPTSYLILFLPTSYLILFLPTSYLILFLPTSYLILFLPTSYLILFLPTSYLILFLPTSYLILFLPTSWPPLLPGSDAGGRLRVAEALDASLAPATRCAYLAALGAPGSVERSPRHRSAPSAAAGARRVPRRARRDVRARHSRGRPHGHRVAASHGGRRLARPWLRACGRPSRDCDSAPSTSLSASTA